MCTRRQNRYLLSLILCSISFSMAAIAQQGAAETSPTTQTQVLKFSYARPWRGCGPTDRAQSGIILTNGKQQCTKSVNDSEPRPYISVMYDLTAKTAPVKVYYATSMSAASAMRCLAAHEKCDRATGGTINFDLRKSKSRLPNYELEFADGSVIKGTFTLGEECHPEVQCW